MSLKTRISDEMKDAMRAKDSARLTTIRMLMAAIKQREVDERIELDDAQVIGAVDKLIKQRKDSVVAFQQGGRQDLVDKESAEIAVLQAYLPARSGARGGRSRSCCSSDRTWRQRSRRHGAGDGGGEVAACRARPRWRWCPPR